MVQNNAWNNSRRADRQRFSQTGFTITEMNGAVPNHGALAEQFL